MPKVDVDFYRENGYVHIPGVFDAEYVRHLQSETAALLERANSAGRAMEATWRGDWREAAGAGTATMAATKVDSIHNVQNHSAFFTRLLVDPRLMEPISQLIGPNIQLHHTKLHAKPPAVGSPFPMHQDYPYFPHEGTSMIAAAIHIDDSTVENGCLCLVPGSHKAGPIQHNSEGSHYLPFDQYPLEMAVPAPAAAGDVIVFSYLTIHGSYVNRSDRPRRLLLVQLRSPEDKPLNDAHRSPGQGTMLWGINPDATQR